MPDELHAAAIRRFEEVCLHWIAVLELRDGTTHGVEGSLIGHCLDARSTVVVRAIDLFFGRIFGIAKDHTPGRVVLIRRRPVQTRLAAGPVRLRLEIRSW